MTRILPRGWTFIFVFVLSLIAKNACSQDQILVVSSTSQLFTLSNITLIQDSAQFTDQNTGLEHIIKTENIYRINYSNGKPFEIIVFDDRVDSINCTVDSISKYEVFYHSGDQTPKSVGKDEVFAVLFQEVRNTTLIDSLMSVYLNLYKQTQNSHISLLRNNGTVTGFERVNFLENKTLKIQVVSNDESVSTHSSTSDLTSIIFKQPLIRPKIMKHDNLILTNNGNWVLANSFDSFVGDSISGELYFKEKLIDLKMHNHAVEGLFFYDFLTDREIYDSRIAALQKNQKFKQFEIDFSGGHAYLIAKTPSNISSDAENYIDGLRLGKSFDFSINAYFSSNFGIGAKYKQFATNKASPDVSDDIVIRFFGGTAIVNSFGPNQKMCFHLSLSLGAVYEVNNAMYKGVNYLIEGSTFGAYLSTGFDFIIVKNFALGFNVGLMSAVFNEMSVDGQNVKLSQPENHTHVDGMIGLKLYF